MANNTELRKDNPYFNGWIATLPDGDTFVERDPILFIKSNKDRYYTMKQGDDLWKIAFFAYGNSKYYWVIKDANDIDFAFDVPVGTTLIIPDLNTVQINL